MSTRRFIAFTAGQSPNRLVIVELDVERAGPDGPTLAGLPGLKVDGIRHWALLFVGRARGVRVNGARVSVRTSVGEDRHLAPTSLRFGVVEIDDDHALAWFGLGERGSVAEGSTIMLCPYMAEPPQRPS